MENEEQAAEELKRLLEGDIQCNIRLEEGSTSCGVGTLSEQSVVIGKIASREQEEFWFIEKEQEQNI